MAINPFLHVTSHNLGMLLRLIGMKFSESKKEILHRHAKNFGTFHYQYRHTFQFQKNCAAKTVRLIHESCVK